MTTVYLAGATDDEVVEKLESGDVQLVYSDHSVPVGAVLAYVCESVDVVYMMPRWRSCTTARAVNAAAIAAGVTVRGFE